MKLTEQERYLIKRRRKRIKLSDIASEVGCSVTVLSKWENGNANAVTDKIKMFIESYKQYIDNN